MGVGVKISGLGLPHGFAVELNDLVRTGRTGRDLVGGSPTRVLYLSASARRLITNGRAVVADDNSRKLVDHLLDAGMADPCLSTLPAADPSSVTVVVPVYGRPLALDRLLASMAGKYDVVVVDDCSPDQEAILAVTEKHHARLVRLRENGGPGHARNEGLKRVNTPYVAFVDSDIVVATDTIEILSKHFADPRVALAGPRIHGLKRGSGMTWIERYEHAKSSLDLGGRPGTVRPRSPVSWLPGAFLLARTHAISEGFSSTSRVGEDVDLVWRLVEDGWRVRFEPEAKVWHEHRQSLTTWLSRKAFYGTSAHPLALRHSTAVAPAVLTPWSVAVVAVTLLQKRWSIAAALAITAAAGVQISRKLSRSEQPIQLGLYLATRGSIAAYAQTMGLLLRHWWPLALLGCIFSRRMRRAVAVACLADAAWEYRRSKPHLDPLRFLLARRLDDVAYGAGVWFGAIKGGAIRCLLPDIRWRTSK